MEYIQSRKGQRSTFGRVCDWVILLKEACWALPSVRSAWLAVGSRALGENSRQAWEGVSEHFHGPDYSHCSYFLWKEETKQGEEAFWRWLSLLYGVCKQKLQAQVCLLYHLVKWHPHSQCCHRKSDRQFAVIKTALFAADQSNSAVHVVFTRDRFSKHTQLRRNPLKLDKTQVLP